MTGPGSQRVREIVFLAVGASTPIGILAVNLSAYVMQHLSQFAVGIAVCALLSGLSLNGLTAWAILQRAERFVPQLFAEYRIWLVTVAVLVVLVTAVVGAYLTLLSMQNPRLLPNIYAVLTALWLLVLPVVMTFVARRMGLRSEVRPQPADAIVRDA
jgi:peptidoglycan biosynthesis protein MviN/MurJ (putative lipid II flippase)